MDHILVKKHDVFITYIDGMPGDFTGSTTSTVDGYNIVINKNLPKAKQLRVLKHEINHIIRNHMESPELVREIEEDYG